MPLIYELSYKLLIRVRIVPEISSHRRMLLFDTNEHNGHVYSVHQRKVGSGSTLMTVKTEKTICLKHALPDNKTHLYQLNLMRNASIKVYNSKLRLNNLPAVRRCCVPAVPL